MTLQYNVFANERPGNLAAADFSVRRVILLVEDEPFVREATCNLLEHAGLTSCQLGMRGRQ